MHDRPAKMFADLNIAGQHELFRRLDFFQYASLYWSASVQA